MHYKLQKVTNRTQKSYGKYVARAVHHNTITSDQLEEEIQQNCSAKKSDCKLVLCELAETIARHLQNGDRVVLPYIGTVKLEIESVAVDDAADFDVRKHIKGVRAHLLPKSDKGVQELYEGVRPTPLPPPVMREGE